MATGSTTPTDCPIKFTFEFHKRFATRGHRVNFDEDDQIWRFKDNGEATKDSDRPCSLCGEQPVDGMDACIPHLPGVVNACCGHGKRTGYISFENGVSIQFFPLHIRRKDHETVNFPYTQD